MTESSNGLEALSRDFAQQSGVDHKAVGDLKENTRAIFEELSKALQPINLLLKEQDRNREFSLIYDDATGKTIVSLNDMHSILGNIKLTPEFSNEAKSVDVVISAGHVFGQKLSHPLPIEKVDTILSATASLIRKSLDLPSSDLEHDSKIWKTQEEQGWRSDDLPPDAEYC